MLKIKRNAHPAIISVNISYITKYVTRNLTSVNVIENERRENKANSHYNNTYHYINGGSFSFSFFVVLSLSLSLPFSLVVDRRHSINYTVTL